MPMPTLRDIINSYNAGLDLPQAVTLAPEWYTNPEIFRLEQKLFTRCWQFVGRSEQVIDRGRYMTADTGGERILVVRGSDGVLRGLLNTCRHHAAAVATEPEGQTGRFRCPYHGWTYSLSGALEAAPGFDGAHNFDVAENGLFPVEVTPWRGWVFGRIERGGARLEEFFGADILQSLAVHLENLRWVERRRYVVECNWKVYVDNYLDGGYHVPYLHRALCSTLDYRRYRVQNGARCCLQTCPMSAGNGTTDASTVRKGEEAVYCWLYPNFMINCYEGIMDTNLVIPTGGRSHRGGVRLLFCRRFGAGARPPSGEHRHERTDTGRGCRHL
jgi:phenylpropionate dioxygenase-like ring-hydroxylating dioxygenase large terminal subunit